MASDDDNASNPFANSMDAAGEAFSELASGPGAEAAQVLQDSFTQAADAIEQSLARAARSGEVSMQQLAQSILQNLASMAIERTVDTAFSALTNAVSGGFGGARAAGGFVNPGGSYLVGETGPEVFTPASAGDVQPLSSSGRGVTVNINVGDGGDAQSIRRSQGQIATAVAQAVARGGRNL